MKIILAPAKTMESNFEQEGNKMPHFLHKSEKIVSYFKKLDYEQCKSIWRCNDKITTLNYERFKNMDIYSAHSPAVFTYQGIVYKCLSPETLTDKALKYLDENLFILSGLYGALNAFDMIAEYRLEMQSELSGFPDKRLYDFWGAEIYNYIMEDNKDRTVINLCSREYSKCISNYSGAGELIDICFYTFENGKYKQKATEAKMARGDMLRFMALNEVKDIETVKEYNNYNYRYSEEMSDKDKIVFIR